VAVPGMRLTCQTDDRQYAIMWDFEPIPSGVEQLGYSMAKEKSLGCSMVCLIDKDLGQSQ